MQTQLCQLLLAKDFDNARLLLQSHLQSAEIFDPRSDREWAPIADSIAAEFSKSSGLNATIPFWEGLLEFFLHVLEPTWGHCHKGHIYFRLGILYVRRDLSTARQHLTKAREEDMLLKRAIASSEEQAIALAQQSSSYVALALLERIKDDDFASSPEKEAFLDHLFGPSFDAAIQGQDVDPALLQEALRALVPAQGIQDCIALHRELSTASQLGLPYAVVMLTGTVLEAVLLAILYYDKAVSCTAAGKDILRVELGTLFHEAITHGIFPNSNIQAAAQLVHLFRNRIHPGNESRQTHRLTPRVAITLKTMFELSLVLWKNEATQPC